MGMSDRRPTNGLPPADPQVRRVLDAMYELLPKLMVDIARARRLGKRLIRKFGRGAYKTTRRRDKAARRMLRHLNNLRTMGL